MAFGQYTNYVQEQMLTSKFFFYLDLVFFEGTACFLAGLSVFFAVEGFFTGFVVLDPAILTTFLGATFLTVFFCRFFFTDEAPADEAFTTFFTGFEVFLGFSSLTTLKDPAPLPEVLACLRIPFSIPWAMALRM